MKAEYSFERGKLLDGSDRNEEDFVGVEAALRFDESRFCNGSETHFLPDCVLQ